MLTALGVLLALINCKNFVIINQAFHLQNPNPCAIQPNTQVAYLTINFLVSNFPVGALIVRKYIPFEAGAIKSSTA